LCNIAWFLTEPTDWKRRVMRNARRFIAVLASLVALSTGAVILTTHAADQTTPANAAQPGPVTPPAASGAHRSSLAPATTAPATTAAATPATATTPVPPAKSATPSAKPPAPGAPQVPEESATIRDDPIIVPDPKQSADNSVSFPNDI
jgi:hypothetical protein